MKTHEGSRGIVTFFILRKTAVMHAVRASSESKASWSVTVLQASLIAVTSWFLDDGLNRGRTGSFHLDGIRMEGAALLVSLLRMDTEHSPSLPIKLAVIASSPPQKGHM